MTDEQRIADIREHNRELQTATLHGAVPLKTTMQLTIDIDFLLSQLSERDKRIEELTNICAGLNDVIQGRTKPFSEIRKELKHSPCSACGDGDTAMEFHNHD